MTSRVTDTGSGAAELRQRAASLAGRKVRVGILADAPKRGAKAGPYSLMEVALVHEFGGGHVPARSFIRATMDESAALIRAQQMQLARAVLSGTLTADVALARLGAYVVGLVQARIVAGIAPPLAPSTLRRKKNKPTPLILTGQLRSSVTWAIG